MLGITAFLYKSVFGKFLIKKYKYKVAKLNKLNNDILEISLEPLNRKIRFKPGQFIFISFKQRGLSQESHPFSISSSPSEKYLKITVKNLGDFTCNLLKQLKRWTPTKVEGPFGTFSYQNAHRKNQIWIAGGIGITPFIGMAKSLANNKSNYQIQLFYCVRKQQTAIYLALLKKISKQLANKFEFTVFCSENKGYINFNQIRNLNRNIYNQDIFICGPKPMILSLKKDFIKNGIDKNRIHSTLFHL